MEQTAEILSNYLSGFAAVPEQDARHLRFSNYLTLRLDSISKRIQDYLDVAHSLRFPRNPAPYQCLAKIASEQDECCF